MLIYNELKNKPREFLAVTGLKLDEFEKLLPAFQTAYEPMVLVSYKPIVLIGCLATVMHFLQASTTSR